MKKAIIAIAATALMLALQACGSQPAEQAEQPEPQQTGGEVVVGLDDSFPPMGYRDEAGELIGFDIDLAKEALSRMGKTPVFQPIDWGSKEIELSSKKIDLLWNGVTITPERLEIWAFTEPYIENSQIIIVKNDSPINTKADLAGKKIGVQKESSAVDAIEADAVYDSLGEILEYPDNIAAFLDLDIGRTDAVVADMILARYYIAHNDTDFRVLDEDFGDEAYGVAGRLEDTELMEGVQSALNDMISDGTYDRIYGEWFGE